MITRICRFMPSRVIGVLLVLLLVTSCSSQGDDMSQGIQPSLPTVEGSFGTDPVITLPGGEPPIDLQAVDLVVGTGTSVEASSTLTVNYSLMTWSDGAAIESSFSSAPATFPLSGVILGWQQGLIGAKEGGRRLLVIPPDLGYGESGAGPIAPNETLIFVVDVIEVS